MKSIIFVLLGLACYAHGQTTPVYACTGDVEPLFDSVVVQTQDGICEEFPCSFHAGETVVLDIKVTMNADCETIFQGVYATVEGVKTPFPIKNAEDGCANVQNSVCPLSQGEFIEFQLKLKLPGILPKVDVHLDFYLSNGKDGPNFSCFQLDGKVV